MDIQKRNSTIQGKAYEGRIRKAKTSAEALSSERGEHTRLMR